MSLDVQIGIVCTVLGLLIGFLAFKRERDKDVKSDASQSAVMQTKLDAISTGIQNIQVDLKANDRRLGDAEKDIIRIEESAKSAHKRIDSIENKKGADKDE